MARHTWTSVQINHAICLEIHGVLPFRQIAGKLNALFGGTKTYYTVKDPLDKMPGRLSPSKLARSKYGNVVYAEW
ncbi:hypothetical protein MMC34_005347 [Xylographa carneopallida]|nr:hypothetical protein [Xylographa carneopallida]